MKHDDICLICQDQGRMNKGSYKETLFRSGGELDISLCYIHSLELFKCGQIKFLGKYNQAFPIEERLPDNRYNFQGNFLMSGFK